MAEKKKRSLDVWLVDDNKVYREVPFMVVVDWVVEGRLLETDQVRPAGTEKWYKIASTSALSAYLPKVEPNRAEDQAEAMEPVEMDFAWTRHADDDDDDVDMIPLIDISLVLLVFFMMTTTVAVAAFTAELPDLRHGGDNSSPSGNLWVGIKKVEGKVVYAVGAGDSTGTENLTEDQAFDKVKEMSQTNPTPVEVRIAAEKTLSTATVTQMTARLQTLKNDKVSRVIAEIREKQQ
jgi:biopolymer transport protein ExbD